MIRCNVQGHDIYEQIDMPEVPRKGDILWLSSLTRGHSDVIEVMVTTVEWARDQTVYSGDPNHGVHVWLKVRRTHKVEER